MVRLAAIVACALACILVPRPACGLERVIPTVLEIYPHDPDAFTQGLLIDNGNFLESTGLRGQSTLRRVEITTGAVLQRVALASSEFGEGLTRVGDRLIQLTWQEEIAHVYDRESFEELGVLEYEGEGWGLCFDGERLVMSDGSSSLYFRDPESFELLDSVSVTLDGEPRDMLNELECVDGMVFANIWQTDSIVRIDPSSGEVLTLIDAQGLLTPQERSRADVLNGIAHDAASGNFYITGKLWPSMFLVELDVGGGGPEPGMALAEPDPSPEPTAGEPGPSAAADETVAQIAEPGPQVGRTSARAKRESKGCGMAPYGERTPWGLGLLLVVAAVWASRWR